MKYSIFKVCIFKYPLVNYLSLSYWSVFCIASLCIVLHWFSLRILNFYIDDICFFFPFARFLSMCIIENIDNETKVWNWKVHFCRSLWEIHVICFIVSCTVLVDKFRNISVVLLWTCRLTMNGLLVVSCMGT